MDSGTFLLLYVQVLVFVTCIGYCSLEGDWKAHISLVQSYRTFRQQLWHKLSPIGRCTLFPLINLFVFVVIVYIFCSLFTVFILHAIFVNREKNGN